VALGDGPEVEVGLGKSLGWERGEKGEKSKKREKGRSGE
jgi:hypothetical protein